MHYSIVNFPDTDEVEIIPINWLLPSLDQCWWPPYKSMDRQVKAAMDADEPNIQTWSLFSVAILGGGKKFGTYQQAKHNIGKALDETDPPFESEVETKAIQGRLVNPDDDEIAQTIKNWLKGCTKRIESNNKRLAKRSDPLPLTNSPSVYN
ncbi:hypothetical protein Fcan01_28467 [Folsomia candida]|uniref:Uncharacterized protein n=1 Tax=Folsomia candida TaxID=158441 RepID=A0A226CTK7_FOLCA|nr:hypothetical protein Fcan01_28699 [Folsomia candida]OXA36772.1 hypothetical protein Fcan01_28467 [Folsomia candida]